MGALFQALESQMLTRRARLHMPGHKGDLPFPLGEAARWDMTELPGTDSLYEADGCLRELERRLAALYGARDTLLSAGGSTLCIQAMLALAGAGSAVVCDRNLHVSALCAMGLLDIRPEWVTPRQSGAGGIPRPPAPEDFAAALRAHPDAAAVYVTSPNYYGYAADIAGIARAAHGAGIPLLVDNAHGAHLRFLEGGAHPMPLGADACCDSFHKMLPALTGAAALHLNGRFAYLNAKKCMSWFGSTSPSYLVMLSADLLADGLADGLPQRLRAAAARLSPLREQAGVCGALTDPLRLTVPARATGLSPGQMREYLYGHGIEPELCDGLAAVLLCGADTREGDFARLAAAVASLPHTPPDGGAPLSPMGPLPERGCTIREAMTRPSVRVPLREAAGRIASSMVTRCPPGTPLVMCGEVISGNDIFLLESYGICEVDVVK